MLNVYFYGTSQRARRRTERGNPRSESTTMPLLRWTKMPCRRRRLMCTCADNTTTKMNARLLSSAASGGSSNGPYTLRFIPPPTWSIADLELDRSHPPVSNEELRTLCKRALLDPGLMSKEATDSLRQDLGNMMHMIQSVRDDESVDKLANEAIAEMGHEQDPAAWYYDVPRGVTAAPTREDEDTSSSTARADAQSVLNSFLRPKMNQQGAHHYFEIVTARGLSTNTKDAIAETSKE